MKPVLTDVISEIELSADVSTIPFKSYQPSGDFSFRGSKCSDAVRFCMME